MPGPDAGQPEAADLEETRIVPRPKGSASREQVAASPKCGASRQGSDLSMNSSKRGISVPARKSPQKGKAAATAPVCDKCDGPHATDKCPHFKKVREKHKDAWSMLG